MGHTNNIIGFMSCKNIFIIQHKLSTNTCDAKQLKYSTNNKRHVRAAWDTKWKPAWQMLPGSPMIFSLVCQRGKDRISPRLDLVHCHDGFVCIPS